MIEYTTKTDESVLFACFTKDNISLEVPLTDIAEEDIQAYLEAQLDMAKDVQAEDYYFLEAQNQEEGWWWNGPDDEVHWE
jgi:hypothetical protein